MPDLTVSKIAYMIRLTDEELAHWPKVTMEEMMAGYRRRQAKRRLKLAIMSRRR